jgi:DNA-binding IclR family transcriptional regulator
VNISWEILHTIAETEDATAADITKALEYSKSTIHEHLKALIANRAIIRYTESNPTCVGDPPAYPIYELSFRFFEMGEHTKRQFCPTAVVDRELKRLAEDTGELAHFAIPEYNSAVTVAIEAGRNATDVGMRIGERNPFPVTAPGRAILSTYADADVRYEKVLRNVSDDHPIDTPDAVLEAAEDVCDRGYALDDGESQPGIRTVAAPVVIDGRVIGAVGLSGPASRFHDDAIASELSVEVRSATETIAVEGGD